MPYHDAALERRQLAEQRRQQRCLPARRRARDGGELALGKQDVDVVQLDAVIARCDQRGGDGRVADGGRGLVRISLVHAVGLRLAPAMYRAMLDATCDC